jgi:hypothetical protein
MSSKKIFRYCIAVSLLLAGCKPSLNEPVYSPGEADFSRFVAVGTDLTAGFADGALTREAQENSIPAILASRFSGIGGGTFNQPLLSVGNGFGFSSENYFVGKMKLNSISNCKGIADYSVTYTAGNVADLKWLGTSSMYNNFGIPGAKSFNLYSQYFGKSAPAGNPYYHRFASDTGGVSGLTSTVLGDAFRVNPSFFSLWIGVNDILFYATSGGNGDASGVTATDITPADTFNYALDLIVNSLTSNGAKGLLLNIPDVSDLPFFNSIPYNGLILTSDQAIALNAISPPGISFSEGANPFVVSSSGGSIRQLTAGEYVLSSLPLDSVRCGSWGTPQKPIASTFVLEQQEVNNVIAATTLFNSKLKSVANAKDLAFVDVNAFFKILKSGLVFNGSSFSGLYIRGGAFSLDGIHPNAKGYALIANECIKAINSKFKSTIPEVDVNKYSGTLFP